MRCAPGSMRVGKRCERFGAAASVGRSRHKDGRDLGTRFKNCSKPNPRGNGAECAIAFKEMDKPQRWRFPVHSFSNLDLANLATRFLSS